MDHVNPGGAKAMQVAASVVGSLMEPERENKGNIPHSLSTTLERVANLSKKPSHEKQD